MANSSIMLTCKHCGEALCIGTGYFGSYRTKNQDIFGQLNNFYEKHEYGLCTNYVDASDEAGKHFVILDENENLNDVAEVKHGHWIKNHNEKKCSECGFIYYSNNDDFNYCANCGAKMDERRKNNVG